MHSLANIIVRSGIVSDEQMAEFKKWGMVTDEDEVKALPSPKTAAQFVEQLDQALQDADMVMVRETDLESIRLFLTQQKTGTLHLFDRDAGTKTSFPVAFAVNKLGEYLVPWTSESITELLTNGESYLEHSVDELPKKVFFVNTHELFFGEQKAFVVCAVATHEDSNGTQQAPHRLPE